MLVQTRLNWPNNAVITAEISEEEVLSLVTNICNPSPIVPYDRFSSFDKLLRITVLVCCFVRNCREKYRTKAPYPLISEIRSAEHSWLSISQHDYFNNEIKKKS